MPILRPLLMLSDDLIRVGTQAHGQYEHGHLQFEEPSFSYPAKRRRTTGTDWEELRWSEGAPVGLPSLSYAIKHRQRGEFVSQAIGWTTGLTLGLGTAYALAPSSLARLATGWGAARAGLAIGALYPSFGIAHFVTRQVRKFANLDYQIRRLEMGGDYEDSATAAMARFSAVRDMSSALGASRRFLGREALYLSR